MDSEKAKTKYNNLIEKARVRATSRKDAKLLFPNEFIHEHHIIPRCLGGDERRSNYAYLTTKEHIKAHELLAIIHSNHIGLLAAPELLRKGYGDFTKTTVAKPSNYSEVVRSYVNLIERLVNEPEMNILNDIEKIKKDFSNYKQEHSLFAVKPHQKIMKKNISNECFSFEIEAYRDSLLLLERFTPKEIERRVRKFKHINKASRLSMIKNNIRNHPSSDVWTVLQKY
jgi:hypothetical protein